MNILLDILKYFLILLDFLVWILTVGWLPFVVKKLQGTPQRSVPVGDDVTFRQSPWVTKHQQLATTPYEGVTTIYQLSRRAFERYGQLNCMGTRQYLGSTKDGTKVVNNFGAVQWRTFSQVNDIALRFGAALRGAGLEPAPETTDLDQLRKPCSLAIFENTCAEWMLAAQGCFTQSIIITTIYATLGLSAVVDVIKDCNISAIVCNLSNVANLLGKKQQMKSLKTIIYTRDLVAPDSKVDIPRDGDLTIVSFEEFLETGDCKKYPPSPPKPESCAVVMYTSGSTGKPKGVVVTHFNLLSTIAGAIPALGIKEAEEVYVGYLPLAHILELMAQIGLIGYGNTIGYADPRSLMSAGGRKGALEEFQPTILAGVPKIWDVIKKGAEAKLHGASWIVQFMFQAAFQARAFALNHGYDTPLFKMLVFNKFKKMVGGRLRLTLSGGGPLNPEVQVFVRTCFGCPLIQGYGLTETCAGLAIQAMDDPRTGIAGVPLSCCRVKLESCPDIKDGNGDPYVTTDRVDASGNAVLGRGEILIQGNNVTVGYYMMRDKTHEEYADGFFHTGDIGQFMPDGSIRIVDRKKNLVKLKGGEYIAIEHMEATYANSPWIDPIAGGICCYGDGELDRPVALVQVSRPRATQWGQAHGCDSFEKAVESKELMEAIKADLDQEAKKGGLSNLEKLAGIALISEPWTAENGCLTAANKLDRKTIFETCKAEFQAVCKQGTFH